MPRTLKEKAYRHDDKHKDVISFVNNFSDACTNSPERHEYMKRCDKTQLNVDQSWGKRGKKTEFGFKLATSRGAHDNIINDIEDLTDVDEWVFLTSLQKNEEAKKITDNMEDFVNNMLYKMDYGSYFMDRFAYVPVFGWSPSYGEFFHNNGYAMKPKQSSQPVNGLEWNAEMDTIMNQPKGNIIHPYNWFGNLTQSVYNQDQQGFRMRWYAKDFYSAKAKKDSSDEPLYNVDALDKCIKMLDDGKQDSNDDFYQYVGENEYHKDKNGKGHYIDVVFYFGNLNDCKGYYSDPNIYNVIQTKNLVLRFKEHPIDNLNPMNHMQSHPRIAKPYGRTPLDVTMPHARIADLLINLGIEGTVDNMTKIYSVYEEAYMNPDVFINPKGLINILRLNEPVGANQLPQLLGDRQSGSLKDFEELNTMIDRDRQRSGMGATDMEAGIQGGTADKTATATRAMFESMTKTTRAMVKRIMKRSVMPEIKYFTALYLQHATPEQLKFINRDGEQAEVTPEMGKMFMENMIMRANDTITRNRALEAANAESFMTLAMQMLPQLQEAEWGIKALRWFGKEKGLKGLTEMMPEPKAPEVGQGGEGEGNAEQMQQMAQENEQLKQQIQQMQPMVQENQTLKADRQLETKKIDVLASESQQKLKNEEIKLQNEKLRFEESQEEKAERMATERIEAENNRKKLELEEKKIDKDYDVEMKKIEAQRKQELNQPESNENETNEKYDTMISQLNEKISSLSSEKSEGKEPVINITNVMPDKEENKQKQDFTTTPDGKGGYKTIFKPIKGDNNGNDNNAN